MNHKKQSLLSNNPKLDISMLDVKTKIVLNIPLRFGTYAGHELEWQILEKKDNSALIITKSIIESKAYNTEHRKVTWETCTLRSWLNRDF